MAQAKRRLEKIERFYVEEGSPRSAIAVRDRIYKTFDRLLDFPNSGHVTAFPGRREMLVTPYLIHYRIVKNELQIIDIRHGAQN